jgi:hypothetical protein
LGWTLLKLLRELHSHAAQQIDVLFDLALPAILVRVRGVATALTQCTQLAVDAGEPLLQFVDSSHALTHVRDVR